MHPGARTSALLSWILFPALSGVPGCQNTSLRMEPCRALVAAAPSSWPGHWRTVHAMGPEATPVLVRCLRENPDGPGRQAAIHLLGEWRHPDATADALLQELVAAGGPDATEAALALGKRQNRNAVPLLVTTVQNHDVDITVRAAAACALLDLDEPQHAVPLMRAVLLAATPYGQQLEQEHGLPLKTRWALERYMVIEAIRRFSGGQTFGLDEDAPWPTLRDGTEEFARYVEGRSPR